MFKKLLFILFSIAAFVKLPAQTILNGDFKKWDEYGCPESWNCNNDADCKGKVTKADKIAGGARLTVMHCFDPAKADRSNNVNMSFNDLSAKILKNKKVKISFDYSFTAAGNDIAYAKIDVDLEEMQDAGGNTITGMFDYNGNKDGTLKPGINQHMDCYISFGLAGKKYNCPDDVTASSIRTTFAITAAPGTNDVHKGSALTINHVKFTIE